MANLIRIPGIGKTSLELLEAVGFHDAEALANAVTPDLARELERANAILKISKRTPGPEAIQKWIVAARELVGPAEQAVSHASHPVNYELNPQVHSMLASAPLAIPLPARTLVENQLGVADIPAAILLNRYAGDLDVRVEQRLPANRQPKPAAAPNTYVRIADQGQSRPEIDNSRFRTTGDLGDPSPKVAEIDLLPEIDRVSLIRTPRVATNKGRDPRSRWYIRGVLHSHPLSVYLGAVTTLLVLIMIPLAVISSALLLASVEIPARFGWVPEWLLVVPVALPLFGIAYLIWGLGGSCRICGQKLFMHRSHLKNSKAHHIRGLGYILPLCVQILLFRWFRCTHCGTPVRLKE
ncbi:MAG: DUF4332 domain-containing protein [Verrucomicrobiota bacterium]